MIKGGAVNVIRYVVLAVAMMTALWGLSACGQSSSPSPGMTGNAAASTTATTTLVAAQ